MHAYLKVYEFAASLGAFEGYVYGKTDAGEYNMPAMDNWSKNIETAYQHLPAEMLNEIQAQCNQTAGRAICSIEPVLGNDHPITQRIRSVIQEDSVLPDSADAFNKTKWFTHEQ